MLEICGRIVFEFLLLANQNSQWLLNLFFSQYQNIFKYMQEGDENIIKETIFHVNKTISKLRNFQRSNLWQIIEGGGLTNI